MIIPGKLKNYIKSVRPEGGLLGPIRGIRTFAPLNSQLKLLRRGERVRLVLALFMTLIHIQVACSPGCMDNSWHLARPFDNKEYHIVGRKVGRNETYCPCPCRKLSLSRGQCLECGHKHEIQPWIIVRTPKLR